MTSETNSSLFTDAIDSIQGSSSTLSCTSSDINEHTRALEQHEPTRDPKTGRRLLYCKCCTTYSSNNKPSAAFEATTSNCQ